MKDKSKRFLISLILIVLTFGFVFSFVSIKTPVFESTNTIKVSAQLPVVDPQALMQRTFQQGISIAHKTEDKLAWLKDAWRWLRDKVLVRTTNIVYKNALRNFLSQMAYRTAVWISESGPGQGPLFTTESWKEFSQGIVETTLVDTLDVLASDNGFFEFNVCQPSELDFSLTLLYTNFKEFGYDYALHKPKCSWQNLKKNWTDFRTGIAQNFESNQAFFDSVKNAFKPTEQNIGIALKIDESISSKIKDKKTQQFLQRIENQGLKPITEPITERIKTPAKFIGFQAQTLPAQAPVAETTPTGDIIADAMGIFTNTLVSKLLERWLKDATGGKEAAESTQSYSFVPQQAGAGQLAQQQQFGGLAEVTYTSGQENILEYLVSCPDINNPGPTDCVVPQDLVSAIERKLTVKEAIDEGSLHKNWVVGWEADTQPNYNSGYPYRSLVIMRTYRIIPVGWELAAWYAKMAGETVTLEKLINCFEDNNPSLATDPRHPESCRVDMNNDGDINDDTDYNPYYHLVDPNWVLKASEMFCNKKGSGFEVIGEEWACSKDNVSATMPPNFAGDPDPYPYCEADAANPDVPVKLVDRDSGYCADWASCLIEDEQGNCTGIRGYCLKERELWRFEGDSCPAQYASCQNLTRSDDQQFSYLTNTLKECYSPGDAGCQWYALEQERAAPPTSTLEWQVEGADPRIYLNSKAQSCSTADIGCTKLGRMVPGANLVVDGDFEDIDENAEFPALNWSEHNPDCPMEVIENEGVGGSKAVEIENTMSLSLCGVKSTYIPIDSRFSYILSAAIKSTDTDPQASLWVYFYETIGATFISSHNITNTVNVTANWQTFSGLIGNPELGASVTIPPNANYVEVHAYAALGDTVDFDNVQLGIVASPIVRHNPENFSYSTTYTADYSQTSNPLFSQHLKLAPGYLDCDKYNEILLQYPNEEACNLADPDYYWRSDIGFCVAGGDELCESYATYCQAEEIGCQGYAPVNGDPEVPAITEADDVCPAECVGYDSYIEQTSFFEEVECPSYSQNVCATKAGCAWNGANGCLAQPSQRLFIPPTAQSCPAADAGCEEFTNLDEVAKGGEGLEYFTYLRQCISPDNPNLGYYYTWEGSDTTGYQLKKWEFLKSGLVDVDYFSSGLITEDGTAPCTNITIGTEQCSDTDFAGFYMHSIGGVAGDSYPKVCSQADIEAGYYDCRDFFDASGNHFYRWQSYAVIASAECHPYRRTATGQIYNADPAEGISCSAASNNCREYKGNAGNNIRVILNDNFESGTVGDWGYWYDEQGPGVQISNESVVQSGHSLRAYVSNNKVGYPLTGEITAGKQYLISFWGKKAWDSACPSKYVPATTIAPEGVGFLQFNTALTNLWDDYEIGPITSVGSFNEYYLNIGITGLDSCEAFYIDNVVLKEYTDNFYAVRDSWQTPVACDNNLDNPFGIGECTGPAGQTCTTMQNGVQYSCYIEPGSSSCQAAGLRFNLGVQQGCQQYADRNNSTHYLKKFSNICSDTAIGCEAYLSTQNSTAYQAEHTYGAFVCDDVIGEIDDADDCWIRGQVMCNTAGADSCEYSAYPPGPPTGVSGNTIPNDELVYVVNDPEKSCSPSKQGCMALGQPELNMQIGDLTDPDYVVSTESVLLINNPDDYDNILCGPTGEFCTEYTDNAQAKYYYYDPMSLAVANAGATTKTCYYNGTEAEWQTSGENAACPGQVTDSVSGISYLSRSSDYNYQGWAGLCDAVSSGCQMYLDPQDPLVDKVDECDAVLMPQSSNVCNSETGSFETVGSHEYCVITVNSLEYKVCDTGPNSNCVEDPVGSDNWIYGSNGWICDLSAVVGAQTDCCLGGQTPACNNEADETRVCTVYPGNDRCYYNLQCTPYNYLEDTVSAQGCNGLVDKEKGCILFNNTNLTTLNFSSESTQDNAAAAVCNSNQSLLFDQDCDANTLLKVRKDRECAEWLQCGSSFIDPAGQKLCLDLIRCSSVGAAGQSCTNIIPSPSSPEELTINLTDPDIRADEFNSIRYLSGYSHAGAEWTSDIKVAGYYPPEQMMQIGNAQGVLNGNMETMVDLQQLPLNWVEYGRFNSGPYCEYQTDYTQPASGMFSAKLVLTGDAEEFVIADPEHSTYCGMANTNSGEYYLINPDQRYSLNLWLKSENGAQRATFGLTWYDGGGDRCEDENNFCDPNGVQVAGMDIWGSSKPSYSNIPQQWTRYNLIFGPIGDPDVDFEIPVLARKAEIHIWGPDIYYNPTTLVVTGATGYLLADDVTFEPVLKVNEDLLMPKDCRLFAKPNSPACAYTDVVQYQGWNGYCLEPDPFTAYNPDPLTLKDTQTCLQWYPVDSLAGDSLVFNIEAVGYTGADEMYYCAQSEGYGNLGKVASGPGALTSGYKVQSKIKLDTHLAHTDDQTYGDTCPGVDDVGDNNISACNLWSDLAGDDDGPVRTSLNCYRSSGSSNLTCEINEGYGDPNICSKINSDNNCFENSYLPYWSCAEDSIDGDYHIHTQDIYETVNIGGYCCKHCGNVDPIITVDNEITLEDVSGIYVQTVVSYRATERNQFLERRDDGDIVYFSTHWSGGGSTPSTCSAGGGDNGDWSVFIKFEPTIVGGINTKRITQIKFLGCTGGFGGTVDQDAGEVINIYYYLKEPCTTIVKTVSAGNEKVWLTRYDYGWATSSNNILGYNRNLPSGTPFYGTFGNIPNYDPLGPGSWGNEPFTVSLYNSNNAGLPYATLRDMGAVSSGSGRTCIYSSDPAKVGISCTDNADCGIDGICAGIGKYCFNTEGVSTAERCETSTDCTMSEGEECKAIGHTITDPNATSQLYEAIVEDAAFRIQQLYAQIFGLWQWNSELNYYEQCLDSNGFCGTGLIVDDFDRSEDLGSAGKIEKIYIRNQQSGDIQLEVPGEEVDLVFNTNIINDQLPIDEITIDWHDGDMTSLPGPLQEKPDGSANPHNVTHTYTCSPDVTGTICQSCSPGGLLLGGFCKYVAPSINLRDHWDWCLNGSILDNVFCNPEDGVSYGAYNATTGLYTIGSSSPYYIIVGP